MSNAIGSSRESNPSRTICNLRVVRQGYVVTWSFMSGTPAKHSRNCTTYAILHLSIIIKPCASIVTAQLVYPFIIKKSNLHYTRGITPKRVTSGEAHLRCLAPWLYTAPKKHRNGGEPLATLQRFDRPGNPVILLVWRRDNINSLFLHVFVLAGILFTIIIILLIYYFAYTLQVVRHCVSFCC